MSDVSTTQILLLRHARHGSEADLARQISRVSASEANFQDILARICDLAGRRASAGVIVPAEPLEALLPEPKVFGASTAAGSSSPVVAPIRADGKNWGELRVYFDSGQVPAGSQLPFATFVAQQIGLAAVLADLRLTQQSLRRQASRLQSAVAKRKAVHRAKALLSRAHKLSEDEAFLLLRRFCYQSGHTLHQVADAVVLNERRKAVPLPIHFSVIPKSHRRVGAD